MFKKLRTIWSNPLVALSACLVFLLFSCQESIQTAQRNNYTGEELFAGIFFGQGEVASKLPSLEKRMTYRNIVDSDTYTKERIEAVQALLIKKIKAENPTYFDQFKVAINSGDHLRIKQTLHDAGPILTRAIERVAGMNSEQLSNTATQLIEEYNLQDAHGKLSPETLKETLKNMSLKRSSSAGMQEQCMDIVLVLVVLIVLVAVEVIGAIDIITVAVVVTTVEVLTEIDTDPPNARAKGAGLFLDQLIDNIAVNLK